MTKAHRINGMNFSHRLKAILVQVRSIKSAGEF